jgi:hypothetical protein
MMSCAAKSFNGICPEGNSMQKKQNNISLDNVIFKEPFILAPT